MAEFFLINAGCYLYVCFFNFPVKLKQGVGGMSRREAIIFLNSCNVYYFRQKQCFFWGGGVVTAIYQLYSRPATR